MEIEEGKELPLKEKEIITGNKDRNRRTSNRLCPASLLLFASGGKKQLKTQPLICLTCDL